MQGGSTCSRHCWRILVLYVSVSTVSKLTNGLLRMVISEYDNSKLLSIIHLKVSKNLGRGETLQIIYTDFAREGNNVEIDTGPRLT